MKVDARETFSSAKQIFGRDPLWDAPPNDLMKRLTRKHKNFLTFPIALSYIFMPSVLSVLARGIPLDPLPEL